MLIALVSRERQSSEEVAPPPISGERQHDRSQIPSGNFRALRTETIAVKAYRTKEAVGFAVAGAQDHW